MQVLAGGSLLLLELAFYVILTMYGSPFVSIYSDILGPE